MGLRCQIGFGDKKNKEAMNAVFPVKQMLSSMLAEMYWEYYEHNRYSILKRSRVGGGVNACITGGWCEYALTVSFDLKLWEKPNRRAITARVYAVVINLIG
jgi:hypothetical protein